MEKFFSISYPRSGATFLKFLIFQIDHGFKRKRKIYEKRHGFNTELQPLEIDGLVLVLRDYKECLISGKKNIIGMPEKQEIDNYFKAIQIFELCKCPKLIVYYEDFVTNIVYELSRLTEAFGLNFSGIIDKLPQLREQSRTEYAYQDKVYSNGKTPHFHKHKLSKFQQIDWDNKFYERNPELFKEYLKRYWYGIEYPVTQLSYTQKRMRYA